MIYRFYVFAALAVLGLVTFLIHFSKPVTWKDGEGSPMDDAVVSSGAFRDDDDE